MVSSSEISLMVNTTYAGQSLHLDDSSDDALYMFIFWGIFLPIVAAAGLVGNILTIIVLWRREMHSTTILYLRALVITDTGILIGAVFSLTIIACAEYLHGDLEYYRHQIYPVIHTPGYYLVMALQTCNVWITVSVSMERYIAICHPFRAARLVTRRKTFIVLACIVVISLLYNIPHLFATHAVPCTIPNHNTTAAPGVAMALQDHTNASTIHANIPSVHLYSIYRNSSSAVTTSLPADVTSSPVVHCLVVGDTDFAETWIYKMYRKVLYTVVIYVIPFLALVVLNSFLIKELMTMQQRRSGTNIHDENEANLSLVLVLIVIVFIFCQTPGLISQFDIIPLKHFFKWLAFANFMFATNSAVNFLIYTAFGRKFRRVLLRVFRHIYNGGRRSSSHGSCRVTQFTNDYELSKKSTESIHSVKGGNKKDPRKDPNSKNNGIRGLEGKLLSTVHEVSSSGTQDNLVNGFGAPVEKLSSEHFSPSRKEKAYDDGERIPLTTFNEEDVSPLPDVVEHPEGVSRGLTKTVNEHELNGRSDVQMSTADQPSGLSNGGHYQDR